MTERINTMLVAAESAVFSPTDAFFVQVKAANNKAVFDVMARWMPVPIGP